MKKLRFFLLLFIGVFFAVISEASPMGNIFNKDPKENKPGQELAVKSVGGRIAFQSNRDGSFGEIWVLEGGQIKKILSDKKGASDLPKGFPRMFGDALAGYRRPNWSPDGSRILFASERGFLIFDKNGSLLKEIKPSGTPKDAVWSQDGNSIYFSKIDKLPSGGGTNNIYLFNLENHSERQITDLDPLPGIRSIISFAVSPDDKKIAFVMDGGHEYGISIWTINADGADLKCVIKRALEPAWSPDSTKIVYVSRNLPSGERAGEYLDVYFLDVTSGQTTRVTNNQWEEHCPVFSPDGKQIAYQSTRHIERIHGAELFVINIDGTGEARLTPPQRNSKYPPQSTDAWATDQDPDWTA